MADVDYVIIGSGFGGSVSALRLAEKGYSVQVLEAGKRWHGKDFPSTNWKFWKFLWAPKLFSYGIQRITLLKDVLILSGAGVGGGSLVYANTSLVPPEHIFSSQDWPRGLDWYGELAPYYKLARRMLGITRTPGLFASDKLLKSYAEDIGRGDTFHSTDVAVYFGQAGVTVKDPFFNGEGPDRTGCVLCGGCMVGCQHGAKNTLDKNYLFLAEKRGAQIVPETLVTGIEPHPEGGYLVHTECTTSIFKRRKTIHASGVVLAAGALGSTRLLLECKDRGTLPKVSDRVGDFVRTNSEALVGVSAKDDTDYSTGIAITSGIYVSADTHIEVVRYPKGSDLMGLLATLLVDNGTRLTRPLKWMWTVLSHPWEWIKALFPFGWARRSIILLVMQTLDNSIKLRLERPWWWPFTKRMTTTSAAGEAVPTFIPAANAAAKAMAIKIGGTPSSATNEVLLNVATTAHILGGCKMGNSPQDGVIDKDQKLFGYDNFFVIDGSSIPTNLGVNPSLTITALAEHAMAQIPDREGVALPPKVQLS